MLWKCYKSNFFLIIDFFFLFNIRHKKKKNTSQTTFCLTLFRWRLDSTFMSRVCVFYGFYLFIFILSTSCIVHGTWIVHSGLWTVTRIVHAHRLHCAGDIVHCSRDLHPLYSEKILKMGLTELFIHLKIILLQYFQFSVFSFQQNKLYSNEPKVSNFSIFLPCTSKP